MQLPGRKSGYGCILVMILALLVITMPVMACEEPTPTLTPTPPPTPPPQPAPSLDWYDCHWLYRKAVTIDKAKVAGSLSNFPVLISLASDPDLSTRARSDGDDILFTSSDGITKLSHEIESYTSGTGKLVAWVKVPSLSSAESTTLYLYYGYDASSDQQDKNNVWNGNYRAVWHLKEDPSGASPQMKDSTSKARHGTSHGGMTRSDLVAGKAGSSLDFDGTNDYLSASNSGSSLNLGQTFTLEAWVKRGSTGAQTVLTKTYGDQYSFKLAFSGSNALQLYVNNGAGGWASVTGDAITDTNWHLVGAYSDGTKLKLFTDGVVNANTGSTPASLPYDSGALFIGVGRWGGTPVDYWDGIIDEVRVSTGARSSSWIRTEYNNQKSPSTFHYLGSEERAGDFELCIPPSPPPEPVPGTCSIGVDATSTGQADETQSITIPHTTSGTERLMLVGVSLNDDEHETVSSVTYGGDALTRVGAIDNSRSGGDDARVEIWRLLAPPTGTHNVVITFSAPLEEEAVAGVMTFTGVDQESPLGIFASSENDPSPARVTVPSAPYDLVFGVLASEYGAITTGWSQTERWNLRPDSDDTYGAGSTRAGATSVVLQWTITGSPHWAAGGVSIRPCFIPPSPPPAPFTCPDTSRSLVTDNGETVGCVAVSNDDVNLYVGFTASPSVQLKTADWTWGLQPGDIPQDSGVPAVAMFPFTHLFTADEQSYDFPGVDITSVITSDIAYITLSAHTTTQSGEDAWVVSDTLTDVTGAEAKYFTYIIMG